MVDGKRYIVDEDGNRTAVVLPLEEYDGLIDDLEDLALIAERREEPAISLEDLSKKLETRWKNTGSN